MWKACPHFIHAIVILLSLASGIVAASSSDIPISNSINGAHGMAPPPPSRREIPSKVLIGYASHKYDNLRKAVMHDGVNVVIWAFMDIVSHSGSSVHIAVEDNHQLLSSHRILGNDQIEPQQPSFASIKTGLELETIKQLIEELDANGYSHVVHLASFGGWNGPHIDPLLDAQEWFSGWKSSSASEIFHGIDWDLEGNDNLTNPNNIFSVDCLEKMGKISQLMKDDGYVVTMAPPQSYLNFNSSEFSRYVNLTVPERRWRSDFEYFGSNVYAYLLAKYGDFVDLVSIQLYESYSDAAMAIYYDGMAAEEYLLNFIQNLAAQNESFYVDFSRDHSLNMKAQLVNMPISKLVIGLANGWTASSSSQNKSVYISAAECQEAYKKLKGSELGDVSPRGFMIWTMDERGAGGVFLARDIGKFLFDNV